MTATTDAEKAEILSQRRTRMLPLLAAMFLMQQFTFMNGGVGSGDRPVDHVRIAAWLVLSIVILVCLTTGGGWIYSREVRRLANDEATRVHRERSFRAGFLASMATCVIVYFASFFEVVPGRDAIRWVMTVGIAVTLLWFAFLERRASRDG